MRRGEMRMERNEVEMRRDEMRMGVNGAEMGRAEVSLVSIAIIKHSP